MIEALVVVWLLSRMAAKTTKNKQTKATKATISNPTHMVVPRVVDHGNEWPFVAVIKAFVVVWLLSRRPPKPGKTRKQRQQKRQ
jgi:hypothetical protein